MDAPGEPALLQVLRAHRGDVTCADAVRARLVTGGTDRALRLWHWRPPCGWSEHARAPGAHRYGVTAARWAPSGVLLASGGVDGAARLWCGRTLAARRLLAAPGAPAVRALCWAGRARLLVGHDDGTLRVWYAPRALLIARLLAHDGALHAVCAPAAALLITACTEGVLKVFDLADVCRAGAEGAEGAEGADLAAPAPLCWLDGAHDLGALCADATECGEAATGGHDALVRVWRTRGRGPLEPCGSLAGHAAAVTALRWGAGGALLASASLDRTARLWAPRAAPEPTCLRVLHAHARYLTCIALAEDARYLVTGSNDKSVRMWSLGSLTLEEELEPPCVTLEHFALGDLEGIELPSDASDDVSIAPEGASAASDDEDASGAGAVLVWSERAHQGAINSVASHGDMLATASSDGWVRVYQWREHGAAEGGELVERHALHAHEYPATAVDFGAGGAVLLSAGYDGRACLWDVLTGVQLCVVSAPEVEAAGGGGVRGARLSPARPARVLLATDDGVAAQWCLGSADPCPELMAERAPDALTCCAWAPDARVAVAGAAGGELHVLAPRAGTLHVELRAHDLGVQSCDFAPHCDELELAECSYLLASAGCDSLIKLWTLDTQQEDESVVSARVQLMRQVEAHGGGAACVRWAGAGGLLASAGGDRWARVWRARAGGLEVQAVGAAPAAGAGGAPAVALLARAGTLPLLACGTLTGELTLWRLPAHAEHDDDKDEGAPTCLWGRAGVTRWLREYVTRAPGAHVTIEEEAALLRRAHDTNLTGATLLGVTINELLEELGYGAACEEGVTDSRAETRDRLRNELAWLRNAPPPSTLRWCAPHSLLCPLSHALLGEPVRAADGYTYERAHILDWFVAAEGGVSPVTSRRLRNTHVSPNYALRDTLRQFLRDNGHAPPPP